MGKKAKRVPFESTDKAKREKARSKSGLQEEVQSSGFFRSHSTRESIESIIVAIMLALIFKTYEVEAFVIPTGSMAPSLQGRHHDIDCPKCGHRYRTGISTNNPSDAVIEHVDATYCPICKYSLKLESRKREPDHGYFSGDRILVNKMAYDFSLPKRWDVIVFKNPYNAKQNYIKRLVGLPGEGLLIENGDVFTWDLESESFEDRRIARKNHRKLRTMLQLVDDNHRIPDDFKEINWPLRWQQWNNDSQWEVDESSGHPVYRSSGNGNGQAWLRYRHIVPRTSDWPAIEDHSLQSARIPTQGAFIDDHYCYNERIAKSNGSRFIRGPFGAGDAVRDQFFSDDPHGLRPRDYQCWVGDLAMEVELEVENESGEVLLDLVEGGTHFVCSIDVSSGTATLKCEDPSVTFIDSLGDKVESPSASTKLTGSGRYSIRYANVDDAIYLWVNNQAIEFSDERFQTYRRTGKIYPSWSESNAGDAEPLGIASDGTEIKIDRIKVLRDIYYRSVCVPRGRNTEFGTEFGINQLSSNGNSQRFLPLEWSELSRSPSSWSQQNFKAFMDRRERSESDAFLIAEDGYFPMGDNSPQSLDARYWPDLSYVPEKFMIGKALFVYWPHSLNKPIPYFPNFWDMKFIR